MRIYSFVGPFAHKGFHYSTAYRIKGTPPSENRIIAASPRFRTLVRAFDFQPPDHSNFDAQWLAGHALFLLVVAFLFIILPGVRILSERTTDNKTLEAENSAEIAIAVPYLNCP